MTVSGIKYRKPGAWYRRNLDPMYGYRRGSMSAGFITNGRGIAFHLHGGTRHQEIVKLCEYLDYLEWKAQERG